MKVKKGRISYIKDKIPLHSIMKANIQRGSQDLKQLINLNRSRYKIDPRPIHDKKYMSFCLKEIKNFLYKNGYKFYDFKKIQYPLDKKEFFRVCFFLVKKIDKNFKIKNNSEIELPAIFKLLGYPFPLTKTTLASSTNLYSSPTLTNHLYWIVELCLYDSKTKYENELIKLKIPKKTLIWYRFVKSYFRFLSRKGDKDNFKNLFQLKLKNLLDIQKIYKNKKENLIKKVKKISILLEIFLFITLIYKQNLEKKVQTKKSFFDFLILLEIDQSYLIKSFENQKEIKKNDLNSKEKRIIFSYYSD